MNSHEIEEANLLFAERELKRRGYATPPGAIIMVTSGEVDGQLRQELAVLKKPDGEMNLEEFENTAATISEAMGLEHREDNVLFVTVE